MDEPLLGPAKSRQDILEMIARTQAKIIESLNTLDNEAASIENADLIRRELEHLRDLLGVLWFSYSAAMAMPPATQNHGQPNEV